MTSQKLLDLDEENQEAYDDLIVSIEAKEGALKSLAPSFHPVINTGRVSKH